MSEKVSDTQEVGTLFVESLRSIASFLDLGDVLACRLTCMEALNQIHAALTVEDCADRLCLILQNRQVIVLGDTRQWKDAGNDTFDVMHCLRQLDTTVTNPLDAVFRIMRVLTHLPEQLAVLYSGKYGRFCVPCQKQTGALELDAYPKCPRGKRNCPTCSLDIPPRAVADGKDQNDEQKEEDETREPLNIYSVLSIARNHDKDPSQGTYSMDLESFHCKCVPNLPPNLICPLCRESKRRTLLLTAFSYQSEPSAAREQPGHMSLSFTPLLEPEAKRTRREQPNENNSNSFPPQYSDMFLPRYSGSLVLRRLFRQDCKHAMSIHCTSCQNFGLIAPARLCMPCHLRVDEEEKSVGGVLFRPTAEDEARMHCRYCILVNNSWRADSQPRAETEEDSDSSKDAGRENEEGVSYADDEDGHRSESVFGQDYDNEIHSADDDEGHSNGDPDYAYYECGADRDDYNGDY